MLIVPRLAVYASIALACSCKGVDPFAVTCVPDCSNRDCGDDGCGRRCGTCSSGVCSASGVCTPPSSDGGSSSDTGAGTGGDAGLPRDAGGTGDASVQPDAGGSRDAGTAPPCGEGTVTSACSCAGVARTSGYCCGGLWQATACSSSDLLPAGRVTAWNPGILSDAQKGQPLGADGLPQRTTLCATLSPGSNIQAALDSCPEGQVVQLSAGTFTVSSTITLSKGVVLRGAGSQGAPTGTTLVKSGGQTALAIGTVRDQSCYGGTGYALTADALKESSTVSVGTAARNFSPGDLALIDQVDDSTIRQGDCNYFKRVSGRSASQRVEIKAVDIAQGVLTLSSPLHWTFKAASPALAQITRVTQTVIRWAGIESLRLQGGTNSGYNGQMAGGIDISNAAYCWVKDVQTDGTIGGMHVSLTAAYRCVVRDGYFHHSASYGFGEDCYGIVLRCGAADNLVENNIVRYMNKPILFNSTGGGNVVAYNYADNSWATPPAWQEVNIDCHCSFPHMELIEGNWAPHMGATATHGTAGYLTFYRNYASSVFAPPAVYGSTSAQDSNVTAFELQSGDIGMNLLGNILGAEGVSTVYDSYNSSSPKSIYELGGGNGGTGATDVVVTTLYRHGNYDYVHHDTIWSATTTARTLPASLYLAQQPTWWPAGTRWPWAGPDQSPMVGVLPAKNRSDRMAQ